MIQKRTFEGVEISGNKSKIVAGDDNSQNNFFVSKKGKLSLLFESLKEKFEEDDKITRISDDLQRYKDGRDRISIEQKLKDANREHLTEDFLWLKDQYFRKLTKYQFFEPAQEIHAFILGIVYERFRNIIYPLIRQNESEKVILSAMSEKITAPIVNLIQEEGCDDIMGLSSTEIEGMIHFLTGQCHIKWKL
ncbi:ABC-three component system protein [Aureivirga sp. CE67]|uniref:ABC-three component system protein n=1 Tax=Aureivirga sp. CE67 TaxID=1788983 RepID=UPI0018CBAECA|nr:ABC-three component system protein [Aureivirga sp. CE67]